MVLGSSSKPHLSSRIHSLEGEELVQIIKACIRAHADLLQMVNEMVKEFQVS